MLPLIIEKTFSIRRKKNPSATKAYLTSPMPSGFSMEKESSGETADDSQSWSAHYTNFA